MAYGDIIGNSHKNGVNYREKNGVETRIAFPPIHLQPMFNNMFKDLSLPNTMLAYETMLDIPCHAKLTSSEINLIIKIIKKATEK